MNESDSIVIIPTYNEKENIEKIIRAVFSLDGEYHILVIEDGSPDGTAQIVKRLQEEFSNRLFMIERKGKLGLGTAQSRMVTTTSSRWMLTSRTIRTTFHVSTRLALAEVPTLLSAHATAMVSVSSTGLSEES